MDKQLLGFVLLVLGMAAMFGIWVITLRDRSKTIDPVELEAAPVESPRKTFGSAPYSLAPVAMETATVQAGSVAPPSPAQVREADFVANDVSEPAAQQDDDLARTHLEIARQFFNQGDFEGAVEMCSLVAENPSASPAQIEQAQNLRTQCE